MNLHMGRSLGGVTTHGRHKYHWEATSAADGWELVVTAIGFSWEVFSMWIIPDVIIGWCMGCGGGVGRGWGWCLVDQTYWRPILR